MDVAYVFDLVDIYNIFQIIGEPEKVKNKFSSKYRSSYLDKPFYKPTVPTITPSTVSNTTKTRLAYLKLLLMRKWN